MSKIKDRNKILEVIKEIRGFSVKLGDLENVLFIKELTEKAKDEVENSCWELVKELNKLTEKHKL